jgi:glucokinase
MDVGGSRIRTAAVSRQGRILGAVAEEPVISREKRVLIRQLVHRLSEKMKSVSGRGWAPPRAVGIGLPGFLNHRTGVIYASPNFPEWHNVPIRKLLSERLSFPLAVENDANAAALGEAWMGRGRDVQTMLYLGLGTGVGGGVILNRKIWHGTAGLAGELGHITVDPRGPKCGCGNTGCLEAFASATAIVRAYLDRKKGFRGTPPTAEGIYRAARSGDSIAREVYHRAGMALGVAIAGLINIFNPDRVVIGGGVAKAWSLLYPAMRGELVRRAIHPARIRARVTRGALGNRAGILGAAAIAWQRKGVEFF